MKYGINVDPGHGFSAEEVAYTGARLVRFAPWPENDDLDIRFALECIANNIDVCLVLDNKSLLPVRNFVSSIRRVLAKYPNVMYWQIGNEPDSPGDSSWTMTKADYNRLLAAAKEVLKDKYLIAAGLTSGNPNWLTGINLSNMDAISVHPYGQRPDNWGDPTWGFGVASELLQAYRHAAPYIPMWITEWGAQDELFHDATSRAIYHTEMLKTFSDITYIEACAVFCYHDAMVPGYGLLDVDSNPKEAFAAFRDTLV